MKTLKAFVGLSVIAAALTGCGGMAGDLYRMANTSHDAGSCNGFKGKDRSYVESTLDLKPTQSFEDGQTIVAKYEKGNFGAAFVYEGDKASKYFCGSRMFAATLARKYTEELTEAKVPASAPKVGSAAEMMDKFRRAAETGNSGLNP